jgi:peptide methionine sulfoxide reductase MsrA
MTEERAVLAGGCFWGVQDLRRSYPGILSMRVGYTGGYTCHFIRPDWTLPRRKSA